MVLDGGGGHLDRLSHFLRGRAAVFLRHDFLDNVENFETVDLADDFIFHGFSPIFNSVTLRRRSSPVYNKVVDIASFLLDSEGALREKTMFWVWGQIVDGRLRKAVSYLIPQAEYDALLNEQKDLAGAPRFHTEAGDVFPKPEDGWKFMRVSHGGRARVAPTPAKEQEETR